MILMSLALLVLAPTAAQLSRRITLNLALWFGWAALAMWIPAWWLPVDQGTALVAVASAAAAAAWLRRRSKILPRTRMRDLLILGSGIAAAWVARPLRNPGSGEVALSMLALGWDNASHFSMFLEQRSEGVAPPYTAPVADSSGSYFEHYPQWFHSMLTLGADLTFGPVESVRTELLRYGQLQWMVFVAVVVMAIAALVQSLDRTPLLPAMLAVAVASSLLVAVPGGVSLLQGHLNFVLAVAAPTTIAFLQIRRGAPSAIESVAICGLVVVAASWLFVLPLAIVACYPAVARARLVASPKGRLVLGLLVTLTAACSGYLVWVSVGTPVADHLTASGGVISLGLSASVVLMGASLLAAYALCRERTAQRGEPRCQGLLLVATAAALCTSLGVYHVVVSAELSYYFWKSTLAYVVVSLIIVARDTAASAAVGRWLTRPGRSVVVGACVTLAACAGLGMGLREFRPAPSALWANAVPSLLDARRDHVGQLAFVLDLADTLTPAQASSITLVATRAEDVNASTAGQWFHTLTRSRTVDAGEFDVQLVDVGTKPIDDLLGIRVVKAALVTPEQRVWITSRSLYAQLPRHLSRDQMSRVRLVP